MVPLSPSPRLGSERTDQREDDEYRTNQAKQKCERLRPMHTHTSGGIR